MQQSKIFFAQKAIIIHNEKILLIKKNNNVVDECKNRYELPGGKMDFGENIDTSLQREVFEETGIQIIPGQPFDIYDFFFEKNEVKNQVVVLIRFCEALDFNTTTKNQVESDNIDSVVWVELTELKNLPLMDYLEKIFPKIIEKQN
ncbi:MAG: NUDIX hydrolase [Rickettsiales bacterium]|jgi:8-oxo-dGTP diphosphatase|nr:NUDIX hydrolase [Rickettsiales bacterium]